MGNKQSKKLEMADPVTHPGQVAEVMRPVFRRWKWEQEVFSVLLLDGSGVPIRKPLVVAVGTVNLCPVCPRDVFREAVRRNAAAVVVAHCHPSGSLKPSREDRDLTRRLVEAGEIVGVKVYDHLIVSRKEFFSLFADGGISWEG